MPPTLQEATDIEAVEGTTTTVVAEAVLLDDDALPTLPTVLVENGDDVYHNDTVRLESSHIVSVRDHDDPTAACANDRPEFISVTFQPLTINWDKVQHYLGLHLASQGDGSLQLTPSTNEEGVLLRHTAVKTGDVLVSINRTSCHGLSEHAALLALQAATRNALTSNHKTITMRWHNIGGDASRVASTIQKSKPTQSLGFSLARSSGGLNITRIGPHAVLSDSLLNATDRILSVNGQSVAASDTPTEVASWIAAVPVWVTIVAVTTTTTGVVIATGSGPAALPTATATTQLERDTQQKRAFCVAVGVGCVVGLIIAAVVGTSTSGRDVDDFFNDPPTPSPQDFYETVVCNRILPLPVDGTPVFASVGDIQDDFADVTGRAPVSYCEIFSQDAVYDLCRHGYGQWFTFTIGNISGQFEISTCNADQYNALDTVLSVFKGKCGVSSALLEFLGYSDDYSAAPTCEQRSAITMYGQAGQEYIAQVQGYNGVAGDFGIKVVPMDLLEMPLSTEPCVCDEPPSPAPLVASAGPATMASQPPIVSPTGSEPPIVFPTVFPAQ